MKHIRQGKLVGLLIAGGLIWSAFILFSDRGHLLASLRHLSVVRILAVLLFSTINYWIRIIRFNWLTRRVAVATVNTDINSVIFFSGLSMNLTPARIGEVVKAYFQQHFFHESFARMAPIVFIERLTDALAMLVMMSFGVLAFHFGGEMFALLIMMVGAIMFLLHRRDLGERFVKLIERLPAGKTFATPIQRALSSSYRLTEWWPLLVSTVLGVIAWTFEAGGLWILLHGAGTALTSTTLYLVLFIFAVSAAVGFISVIPGGLGVNELSTIGLLQRFVGVPYSDALVVTFAFRIVTLWFGILLGLVSLVYLERRMPS